MANDIFSGLTIWSGGAVDIATIIVVVILVLSVIIGIMFYINHLKRYNQFKIIVWERVQNGNIVQTIDKGGIFLNRRTGNKLLFLKKMNVGLKPDNIKFVFDNRGNRIIYLLRYGFKNFSFIEPIADNVGGIRFVVGEEDVNWAINSYEANKKRFSQSLLFQLLPFMVLALVCIIILILMISLFRNFGVLQGVADSIKETAKIQAGQAGMVGQLGGGLVNGTVGGGGII